MHPLQNTLMLQHAENILAAVSSDTGLSNRLGLQRPKGVVTSCMYLCAAVRVALLGWVVDTFVGILRQSALASHWCSVELGQWFILLMSLCDHSTKTLCHIYTRVSGVFRAWLRKQPVMVHHAHTQHTGSYSDHNQPTLLSRLFDLAISVPGTYIFPACFAGAVGAF